MEDRIHETVDIELDSKMPRYQDFFTRKLREDEEANGEIEYDDDDEEDEDEDEDDDIEEEEEDNEEDDDDNEEEEDY